MKRDMGEKNNRKYAGQVVDIPRSHLRLSINDRLKKMSDEEGDPFLNIFSNRSIYLIKLFNYADKHSLVANLPLRDMPLLKKRTDLAEGAIFKALNSQTERLFSGSKEEAAPLVPTAFQPLKIGKLAGKSPGDLLLKAERTGKTDEVTAMLERQVDFLKGKLKDYPRNQSQIDAIEEAMGYFDLGCLEGYKPEGDTMARYGADMPGAQSGVFIIYKTPIKHQKTKDKRTDKYSCYSITVTCSPTRDYPYRIEIMNCYAPLGQGKNGMLPILMDQAEDIQKDDIDLTEGEWLFKIDDPLPYCQHDCILPIRVKGRQTGNPQWGNYEILSNGNWVDYKPPKI